VIFGTDFSVHKLLFFTLVSAPISRAPPFRGRDLGAMPPTLIEARDAALRAAINEAVSTQPTLRAAAMSLGIIPENLNRYMRRLGVSGPRAMRVAPHRTSLPRAA
jgi:hypothetical protein